MIIRDDPPDDLAPLTGKLLGVAQRGLALFAKRYGSHRAGMTLRSERSLIHDCIKEEAKKEFDSKEKNNLFLMLVGKYRIKPKKLDDRLRSRSIGTQLVFSFLNQTMRLFDDEPRVNLHLGYQPNPIDITKSLIWITCPNGIGIEWAYQLTPPAASTAVPNAPVQPPIAPPLTNRVKPKQTTTKKTGERKE